MSVRISLHCDRLWQYGGCTSQLITDATSTAEARAVGEQLGWRTGAAGVYCPTCSGRNVPPRTNVVHLHPESEGTS